MNRFLIPDLCRLVHSYLFDSVTLPTLKVTISAFANGLFYVTYKDITFVCLLDRFFWNSFSVFALSGVDSSTRLSISTHHDGLSWFMDYTEQLPNALGCLSSEELLHLGAFVQRQLA
jgi:hypothetical protein